MTDTKSAPRVAKARLITARSGGILLETPAIRLLRMDCAKALDLGGSYTIKEHFDPHDGWVVEFEITLP